MADVSQPQAGHLVTWGTAGLVLVCLRLLELAHFRSQAIGDAFWFVSSFGIVASFVGLVLSIVALFKRSGRGMGWVGIGGYLALAGLFLVLHRSPTAAAVLSGRGRPQPPEVVVAEPPGGVDMPDATKAPGPVQDVYTQEIAASRCAQGSTGGMTCATCHVSDHRPPPSEAAAYYRGRCLACHRPDSCNLPVAERQRSPGGDDCRACHMPARAVTEGAGAKRTDHRIPRKV